MRILAVDDEPLIRTLVATVLQDEGYDVLIADCAAQAMAVFHDHAYEVDLLISDIVMPGMDGPTLAAILQSERPDLEVLLMSGYCDREQLSHGFEFLPKPFTISDLLSKVRSLLRNRQSQPRARRRNVTRVPISMVSHVS